jgi:integrase
VLLVAVNVANLYMSPATTQRTDTGTRRRAGVRPVAERAVGDVARILAPRPARRVGQSWSSSVRIGFLVFLVLIARRDAVPLPAVSARLGHANTNVTARIYAHALPADDQRSADTWDAIIGGPVQ